MKLGMKTKYTKFKNTCISIEEMKYFLHERRPYDLEAIYTFTPTFSSSSVISRAFPEVEFFPGLVAESSASFL